MTAARVHNATLGSSLSSGTFGGPGTRLISITGGSLGTGTFEVGVLLNGGMMQVGDGGTITLVGAGGGVYNSSGSGSSNHGVDFATTIISAGIPTGSGQEIRSISPVLEGKEEEVLIAGDIEGSAATRIRLQGTNPLNALNFSNCAGGSGAQNIITA